MSAGTRAMPRLSDLADVAEAPCDVVVWLSAAALLQAHTTAGKLHDVVIPLLPPAKRSFALSLARLFERGTILNEGVLRDIETFSNILAQRIDAGTHVGWQGDDHHVRGGYEVVYRDAEACELAQAAAEVSRLGDMILSVLSTARAIREADALID